MVPKNIKRWCKFFLNKPDEYMFKKCVSNSTLHKCLVILQKNNNKTHFLCNESRSNIKNRFFAKFRCNGAKVVLIIDITTEVPIKSIVHEGPIFNVKTIYECGQFVFPNYFDGNVDIVCTFGIHYFLSAKAALSYDFCLGHCIGYDEDGCRDFLPLCDSLTIYARNNQRTGGCRETPMTSFEKKKLVRHILPQKINNYKFKSSLYQPQSHMKQIRYVGCVQS